MKMIRRRKRRDPPFTPEDFNLYEWAITVERRLTAHETYFKILGVIGCATLSAVISLLVKLLIVP